MGLDAKTAFHRPVLLPFRMGAFVAAVEAGVAVIPLGIKGTRQVLREGSWVPRPGIVQLAFGAPITAEGRDWHAALRLRDEARAFIRAHCGEADLDLDLELDLAPQGHRI